MYIIAGLGNPTKTYEGTRHNIGFDMIDAIADKYNIDVTTKKHKALTGKGRIDGVPVTSIKFRRKILLLYMMISVWKWDSSGFGKRAAPEVITA